MRSTWVSKSWRVGMPLASLAFRKFRRLKDGSGRSAGSTRVRVHRAVLPTATTMSSSPEQRESKSSQEQTELYPRPQDCLACRVIGTAALGGVGIYALNMSRAHAPGSLVGKRIMAGVGVGEYEMIVRVRHGAHRLSGFLVASVLRWKN